MLQVRRSLKCFQNLRSALLNRYPVIDPTRHAISAIAARGMQPSNTRIFSQAVDAATTPSIAERQSLSVNILIDGKEEHRSIHRSFPKANPSKLQVGLSRLLSDAQSTVKQEQAEQSRSQNRHKDLVTRQNVWTLCTNNRAIHRSLLIRKNDLQKIEETIGKAADEIGHHPHIAHKAVEEDLHVVNILCTTHQPTGLSMRDVRLADKIDEIAQQMRDASDYTPPKLDEEKRRVALTLLEDNLRAADAAIESPESMCSIHLSQRSEDRSSAR